MAASYQSTGTPGPALPPRGLVRRRRSPAIVAATVATGIVMLSILLAACGERPSTPDEHLFELVRPSDTNVDFVNTLGYEYAFNIYRYRNFYNGGGVALGDVNNDGYLDIFFTGNQVPNRLYLNNGDFTFTDVTDVAGVQGRRAWSTGVSMVDVNGDGRLDIYVCNAGIVEGDNKKNELYINNGDSTFSERAAAYGIADAGLSVHGSFLDYDRDGDLDLYLVNNSYRNIGSFNLEENTRHVRHRAGGDRLYRNEHVPKRSQPDDGSAGSGHVAQAGYVGVRTASGRSDASADPRFVDVSAEAGIYGSEIGFGLGVSVGDLNRDGWPDMYVSNDFFERDYLYLNNRDGTFSEVLERSMHAVSAAAMGADMADLNGDGYLDVFVTDMLPKEEHRIKTVSAFDNWERYQRYIGDGYYHQFTRNTLQLNRGRRPAIRSDRADGAVRPVAFSEIGRLSGVEASDWSWGAMIADFDHDGYRDLFVANGIYQDLTNADYLVEIRDENTMNEIIRGNVVDFERLIDMIPSNPIANHLFAGRPELRFEEVTDAWGLGTPGFSNGSAYGDLDNDGDLDLVVNNVNMMPFIYRNRTAERYPERAWLQVELKGSYPNTFAVGAQLTAWSSGRQWYVEQQPVRGFQSTVDHTLHLGLGTEISGGRIDSLVLRWPDGLVSRLEDVAVNQRLDIRHSGTEHSEPRPPSVESDPLLTELVAAELGLDWRHRENEHNDFERQPLLFHMRSTEGPALCVGDLNGDGRDDVFLGGARDQAGAVFVQHADGTFRRLEQPALEDDRISEDTDCAMFDAEGNGVLDLYVASGGSEFPSSSSALMDRLYLNDGTGSFVRSDQPLTAAGGGFEPTGVVEAADVDGDGHVDLFVGARMRPFAVGMSADGHLLLNDGAGTFREVTDERAPELRGLGMVTDAAWTDVDGDGDLDLILAGEWMPLTLFENRDGELVRRSDFITASMEDPETVVEGAGGDPPDGTEGWWNAVHLADLDGDGDADLIALNHGLNSRFRASPEEPVHMWVDDFDGNGSTEQILAVYRDGGPYPIALRHDLIDQLPFLEAKYPTYASYAGRTVYDVFSEEQLQRAVHRQVVQLQSVVGWNDGSGRFRIEPLPLEAQLAPMYGIETIETERGPLVFAGGNLYEAKPQVGRYDASYGAVLRADSAGLRSVSFAQSGFVVTGPIRRLATIVSGDRRLLLVGRNDDTLKVYAYDD